MKKLNSPLSWVGGKFRLRDTIISKLPEHKTYVEVFAGAAWVYFRKEPSKVEVINDINGDLVNLYKTLQQKPQEFYDTLWFMFPSRQLFQESYKILEADTERKILTDVERAVLFYYHIKHAFGSRYGAAYGFSKVQPPRRIIGVETITELRDRLSNTYVENLPFDRVIRHYDSPDTVFYCDPPYNSANGSKDYQFVFTEEQHIELRDRLEAVSGKWLLSYDDVPLVRDLYKGFTITKTPQLRYTLNNRTSTGGLKKHELLISNY